jgi:hypothetical protein
MGGVWVPPLLPFKSLSPETTPPTEWRESSPHHIQSCLVSFPNPTGFITNSDLELASVLCHQDVVAPIADCRESSLARLYDNTPAVACIEKESASNISSAAYISRLLALHQCHRRYLTEVS